jgi:hypothetical protein
LLPAAVTADGALVVEPPPVPLLFPLLPQAAATIARAATAAALNNVVRLIRPTFETLLVS